MAGTQIPAPSSRVVDEHDRATVPWFQFFMRLATVATFVRVGRGTPEGHEAAAIGTVFLRTDGGAGATVYVKESGAGTDTGWVAK